jgi:hypothetical protein
MKTNDETYNMIVEVYKRPVPLQSEISNPFSANKRQRKKSLVPKDAKSLPEDISAWTNRNFVEYFAEQYKNLFSGIYKITYSSDCSFINQIMSFMEANELDKNEWTKKYLDWCFKNKEMITNKSGQFLLIDLRNFLNTFYQQVIVDKTDKTIQVDILDDIKKLDSSGRAKEIFSTYGIPIAATYFVHQKNISSADVQSGLMMLLNKYLKGDQEQQVMLMKILQRSISRAPYLPEFEFLNWRDIFSDIVDKYKTEVWFRADDYTGKPQYLLEKFLNK